MRAKHPQQAISLSTAEVRERLAEVINQVAYAKDRVILTRRKKPLAAVVPLEDVALLEAIEEKEDLKALRAAQREVKRKGTISWERIKKDLKLG